MPGLGELKATYLIYGSERVLLEDAVGRLKARVAEQGDLDFNYDVFNAAEDEPDVIVSAAQTLPFMSEKRLVVVRDVHLFGVEAQRGLAEYVRDPSPFTCLVLAAEKINKGGVLYKAVASSGGVVHEYEAPRKSEYPAWIRQRLAEHGKKIIPEASVRVFEVVGDDVGALRNEIDKICLYHDAKAELNTDDVDEVLSATTQASIFELTDSIGKRDAKKALRTLYTLLERNEPLPAVYHTVVRHVRMLLATKVLSQRGMTHTAAIARELGSLGRKGLPEFVARKYRDQSHNFTLARLTEMHGELVEIDFGVKSGRTEFLAALEQFLVKSST